MVQDAKPSPSPLADLIADHLAGRTSAIALLRALMAHKGWRIAIPSEVHNGEPSPPLRVQMFSDDAAIKTLLPSVEDAALPPALLGLDAFAQVLQLPGLAGIDIDPGKTPQLHFGKDDLPLLERMGKALRIEDILRDLDDLQDPFPALRDHEDFLVYVSGEGQGRKLLLAPDRQGRSLAAAFTAEDACDAYVAGNGGTLPGEAKRVKTSGKELCRLLRELSLDGVVFNCRGPIPPQAFSRDLFDLVLD